MHTALFPSATLTELYRFALLLTGRAAAAEAVLGEALAAAEPQLEQMRTAANRQAWMAAQIRQRCMENSQQTALPMVPRLLRGGGEAKDPPELLGLEAYILAGHFHLLPEPERSALALFYLDLFAPEEIARLLKTDLVELGAMLGRARARLQGSLAAAAVAQRS